MWLTIVLSFGFYIPVVLFGDAMPLDRHADDPQDLRLCVDRADRLFCHEKAERRKGRKEKLRDSSRLQKGNAICELNQ